MIVVAGIGGLGVLAAGRTTEPAVQNNTPLDRVQLDGRPVRADRLLYPTDIAAGGDPSVTVVELGEGAGAMVQAPDGTLYRVAASEQGGYKSNLAGDTRNIGDHLVVANTVGDSPGYSWTDGCVVTSVGTEADGATWTPEQVALLDAFTMADGAVDLDIPDGWSIIDHGSNAPLVQLSYAVEPDGVEHDLVLAQSLGASIAARVSPSGSMEPVTLLDGTPAWFEPNQLPAPSLTFTRDGVAVLILGDGLDVDDLITAAAMLAPAPRTWDGLLTEDIEITPDGTVAPGGQPDLCGTPVLSVTQ